MGDSLREQLEGLSDRSMPGTNRRRLGDWRLRGDRGSTGRANSAWPTGEPALSTSDAVDEVERWYESLQLRPGFQMYSGTHPDLTAELDRRGYLEVPGAILMTMAIDDLTTDPRTSAGDAPTMVIESSPSHEFEELVGQPNRVLEMKSTPLRQLFLTLSGPDGDTLGGGRATLDGRWMGISAMKTVPEARRTGVAQRVLWSLAEHGRHHGADRMWLQVMDDNDPARQLYTKAGMCEAHRYHYRFAHSESSR